MAAAVHARGCIAKQASGNTDRMVNDTARDRAIYHALKAADEIAAALQAHLIEEHGADPDRTAAQSPATNSLKLLRQARERLGEGLRAVEAGDIAESEEISFATTAIDKKWSVQHLNQRHEQSILESPRRFTYGGRDWPTWR